MTAMVAKESGGVCMEKIPRFVDTEHYTNL